MWVLNVFISRKAAMPSGDKKTNLKIWKVEKTMLVTKMCTHEDDEDGEKLYNSGRFFFRSYLVDIFGVFRSFPTHTRQAQTGRVKGETWNQRSSTGERFVKDFFSIHTFHSFLHSLVSSLLTRMDCGGGSDSPCTSSLLLVFFVLFVREKYSLLRVHRTMHTRHDTWRVLSCTESPVLRVYECLGKCVEISSQLTSLSLPHRRLPFVNSPWLTHTYTCHYRRWMEWRENSSNSRHKQIPNSFTISEQKYIKNKKKTPPHSSHPSS